MIINCWKKKCVLHIRFVQNIMMSLPPVCLKFLLMKRKEESGFCMRRYRIRLFGVTPENALQLLVLRICASPARLSGVWVFTVVKEWSFDFYQIIYFQKKELSRFFSLSQKTGPRINAPCKRKFLIPTVAAHFPG